MNYTIEVQEHGIDTESYFQGVSGDRTVGIGDCPFEALDDALECAASGWVDGPPPDWEALSTAAQVQLDSKFTPDVYDSHAEEARRVASMACDLIARELGGYEHGFLRDTIIDTLMDNTGDWANLELHYYVSIKVTKEENDV